MRKVDKPMSHITNTSTDAATPYLVLLDGLAGGGGSGAVEAMEKRGQQQLVNSDRLPTKANPSTEEYVALGFTFGEPDPDDPIFRPATLPTGWKREASDHAMWSYIVDELGRRRVAIFYKAAHYDRHADMRLETPYGYCYSALYDDRAPITDDAWLTPARAVAELASIRDEQTARAAEYEKRAAESDSEYWGEEAAKGRQEAAKAQRLIDQIAVK